MIGQIFTSLDCKEGIISFGFGMQTEREKKNLLGGRPKKAGEKVNALRAYRNREDLTQRELARKVGVPQRHISEMENGKRPIGMEIARRFGQVLGVDYRALL